MALVTAVDLDLGRQSGGQPARSRIAAGCAGLGTVRGAARYRAASCSGVRPRWPVPIWCSARRLPVGGVDFRYQLARDGTHHRGAEPRTAMGLRLGDCPRSWFSRPPTAPRRRCASCGMFRQRWPAGSARSTLVLLATMAWMMRRALAPVRRLEQEIAALEAGRACAARRGLSARARRRHQRAERAARIRAQSHRALSRHARQPGAQPEDPAGRDPRQSRQPRGGQHRAERIQLEIDRMAQIVDHQLKRAAAGGGTTLGQARVPLLPLVTDLRAALMKVHARKDLRIEVDIAADSGSSATAAISWSCWATCSTTPASGAARASLISAAPGAGSRAAAAAVDRGRG